jgi:hypothetical protein
MDKEHKLTRELKFRPSSLEHMLDSFDAELIR